MQHVDKPSPLQQQHRVSATGPPGRAQEMLFLKDPDPTEARSLSHGPPGRAQEVLFLKDPDL